MNNKQLSLLYLTIHIILLFSCEGQSSSQKKNFICTSNNLWYKYETRYPLGDEYMFVLTSFSFHFTADSVYIYDDYLEERYCVSWDYNTSTRKLIIDYDYFNVIDIKKDTIFMVNRYNDRIIYINYNMSQKQIKDSIKIYWESLPRINPSFEVESCENPGNIKI